MNTGNVHSLPSAAAPLNVDAMSVLEHWEIPQNIYFTPDEVESKYGHAKQTLAHWRCQGKHLVYHKAGKTVSYPFYGRGSLSLFLKTHSKTSTSGGLNA